MKDDGVIEDHAVAGAMAILFWTEPVPTFDLDVLVFLPASDEAILSLDSLYRWAEARARTAKRRERAAMLLDWPGLNRRLLDEILNRHGLSL